MLSSVKGCALSFVASILVILALCWPAFLNGQPFYYPDTVAYFNGFDSAMSKFVGLKTDWTANREKQDVKPLTALNTRAGTTKAKKQEVVSGRSIYYGALLYVGELLHNEWIPVLLQAIAISGSVYLTLSLFIRPAILASAATLLLLSIMTPMAYFISFQMPDLFAATTILAFTNLILFGWKMPKWQIAFWGVLLAWSVVTHTSHVLICLSLAGLAYILYRFGTFRYRSGWFVIGVIALALGLAWIAETSFQYAVATKYGKKPIRPPFLMARVIADGPGYLYIKNSCPESGFAVCAFADKLPVENADIFLWEKDPSRGVFGVAEPAARRALSEEQFSFAVWAVLNYPFTQVQASIGNILHQLSRFSLEEFNYPPGFIKYFDNSMPMSHLKDMQASPAYRQTMLASPVEWLTLLSVILSLGYFAYVVVRRNRIDWHDRDNQMLVYGAIIVAGVLLNAMITGAISEPHDRYLARVIWLLPFAALVIAFSIHSNGLARLFSIESQSDPHGVS